MPEALDRIMSRIHQIQTLLGENPASNEAFGKELQRCAADRAESGGPASPNLLSHEGSARASAEAFPRTSRGEIPSALEPLVGEASTRTGLPEELISAVMQTESGCRPDAVSPAGALGLMQLMPGTARSLGVEDPLDPRENLLGGAEYLRQQLHRFGSVEKALAAYNAGPRAVQRFGGIPPFRETQNYVRRVLQSIRRLTSRRE